MIRFFNIKNLPKVFKNIHIKSIGKEIEKVLNVKENINIVFVISPKIRQLNKKYREKDEVTDVLSFNIDSESVLGEVYVCPKYLINTVAGENVEEQFVRVLVHGILHLQGYDHTKKFDKFDYKNEPMYIKQEEILNKILRRKT